MKKLLSVVIISMFSFSFGLISESDNKATELIQKVEQAVGGWENLWTKNDVTYQYDYCYPQSGKCDVSEERYIFEGEHSWAKYTRHEVNVMKGVEGTVVQSLVNDKASCVLNQKSITTQEDIGTCNFLRKANYFWFSMMYKLNNPGTFHKYLGEEELEGRSYDKVKLHYDAEKTGKEKNDAYILYINKQTHLVDQFFFSLPAMGVNDIVLKMKLKYEEVEGLKLATQRFIYMPGEDGVYSDEPNLVQSLTKVQFDNGYTPEDFSLN